MKFNLRSKAKITDNKEKLEVSNNDPKIYFNEINNTSALISLHQNVLTSKNNPQAPSKLIGAETLYEHFQGCMWLLLWLGFCMGMNPIVGFNSKVSSDVRFTVFSLRFVIVLLVMSTQLLVAGASIYHLQEKFTITVLSHVAFFTFSGLANLSLIRVAFKWPELVRAINKSRLSAYIDPKCKRLCNIAVIVFMTLALVKTQIFRLDLLVTVINCRPVAGIYKTFVYKGYEWLFSLGVPRTFFGMVFVQILVAVTVVIQTYSDVIIICVGIYLTNIFKRINDKITNTILQNGPPSAWRALREDYNRAAHLVRCFDDSINTLVFISFATNLFFICFQLFNLLGAGSSQTSQTREDTGDLNCTGVDISSYSSKMTELNLKKVYNVFSLILSIGKFVCVTLIIANINTEATAPTVILNNLSPESYCEETERLVVQINNDTVALSGFNLFYVTRGLLLSVFTTIITYELVLMQYKDKM